MNTNGYYRNMELNSMSNIYFEAKFNHVVVVIHTLTNSAGLHPGYSN